MNKCSNKDHLIPENLGLDKLFKYMSIPDDNQLRKERIESIFLGKKLYHSLPEQFNDPFDSNPTAVTNDDARKGARRHLTNMLKKKGEVDKKHIERLLNHTFEQWNGIDNFIQVAITKVFRETRVCCFTEVSDNLLLWAHYADSHKGICLAFDAKKQPASDAIKVNYGSKFPTARYPIPKDSREAVECFLLKSEDWSYEKEFRTFIRTESKFFRHNGQSVLLDGDEITDVYLGCEVGQEQEEYIKRTIEKSDFSPNIWKAKRSATSYKLHFEQV